MKALYITWQDSTSRRWAPVGQLTRQNGAYRFVYTRGAKLPSFRPFGPMQDLEKVYTSDALFPIFANRVLTRNRPEYGEYMSWLGLSEASHDVLEELSRTGGLRATDSLELIPYPEPTDGKYEVYFFSRGLGHLHTENEERARQLKPNERLFLMQDIQNPHDCMALLMRTNDPITLVGYVPRFFSAEFTKLIQLVGSDSVYVTVQQVNNNAPSQYRVLCKLSSRWPVEFKPFAAEEFQPLA